MDDSGEKTRKRGGVWVSVGGVGERVYIAESE